MKTCLVTTTINRPSVLELYRQHGPDVGIIIAGDEQSPHAEIESLRYPIGGYVRYLHPDEQKKWKCSELISFRNIQRRNIALLEAVKWGADIIVSIDDDNIPLSKDCGHDYFDNFQFALRPLFNGIKVSSPTGWFDPGQLLDPVAPHRGFPINVDGSKYEVSHAAGARVGVAAGICLGDPDVSAVTRIARSPIVHRGSELLNSGIVVDPSTRTVFNSQNTALIRELAPAFFMLPGVGRYDDIYASLIMQRVMRERNLHVHFGKPFVWQQRNQHNLVKDLRGEIDGMDHIDAFADLLDGIVMEKDASVTSHVAQCWYEINDRDFFPAKTIDAAGAFMEDMLGVL